jgi:hypothetical protein
MTFKAGEINNPKGRPRELTAVKEAARQHTFAAIDTLVNWMKSNDGPVAVSAAKALLERAWGKPAQPLTDEEGGQLTVIIKQYQLNGDACQK